MIIYGIKATEIASEKINEKCSHCETENSINMVVFQKYLHIFWIPFVPSKKIGVTQCTHCKQVLKNKEFTNNLKNSFEKLKSNSKTPKWTFIGLVLLSFLIISAISGSIRDKKKKIEIIESPMNGDVYEISKDNQFTLYKVNNVNGDTVFVLKNQYESNYNGLKELKRKGDESYLKVQFPILKSELMEKFKKGEIINVNR